MVRLTPNHHPVNKDGLVAWWGYRNTGSVSASGTWLDYSGNGNDATLISDAFVNNEGIDFDGSGTINCGNDSSLNLDGGDFAIMLWFNFTVTGEYKGMLYKRNRGVPYNIYCISALTGGGRLHCVFGKNPDWVVLDSPLAYNDGTWHHVIFTKVGTLYSLYIDGVSVNSTTSTGGGESYTSNPLYLGSDNNVDTFFTGKLDDVMIFNRGFSAGEATQMYLKNKRA